MRELGHLLFTNLLNLTIFESKMAASFCSDIVVHHFGSYLETTDVVTISNRELCTELLGTVHTRRAGPANRADFMTRKPYYNCLENAKSPKQTKVDLVSTMYNTRSIITLRSQRKGFVTKHQPAQPASCKQPLS